MVDDPIMPSIFLTDGDLERAIEIDRLTLDGISLLIGLFQCTEDLGKSFLFLERLKNADTAAQVRATLKAMGESRGEEMRSSLKHLICEKWSYCKKRATAGFGDRRTVYRTLCDLIAPTLAAQKVHLNERDRMFIILVVAYTTRRSLDDLCNCDQ
jgi:hypothetical protein